MCSPRLWRIVCQWETVDALEGHESPARVLGPWAAAASTDAGRDLVLAIDTRTYLTVVFPLGHASEFHASWSRSLRALLRDLRVPHERVEIEGNAVKHLPLVRLSEPRLIEALKVIGFVCAIELSYQDDLRIVQRQLNEFPHDLPPDHVPAQAAQRLFGAQSRDPLGNVR
jgi:hypothetical protein